MGVWPLTCWDFGFEYRRGYGCLSLVSVVCCQVEVSADHSSRGLLPWVVCKTECDRESSIMRRLWPTRGYCAIWKKYVTDVHCVGLICNNYMWRKWTRKLNWHFFCLTGEAMKGLVVVKMTIMVINITYYY